MTEPPVRSELETFAELEQLCARPGYAHVLAAICLRDNTLSFGESLSGEEIAAAYSPERLARNEISLLVGLIAKSPLDRSLPSAADQQAMAQRTHYLMEELHAAVAAPISAAVQRALVEESLPNPFARGEALREAIFYGGESAYDFQYLELAPQKYASDADWFEDRLGFTPLTVAEVVRAVATIQNERLAATVAELPGAREEDRTVLPAYIVSVADVAASSGCDPALVARILDKFAPPESDKNAGFNSIGDFDMTSARPLLRLGDGEFLLFLGYQLPEAFYESPFYWMLEDRAYADTALANRGRFVESITAAYLQRVFGSRRVWRNVRIVNESGDMAGEIDVLAVFANRAIVLQAKSKRLTLESRKGNDRTLRDDFKKAIQGSYEQALSCAKMLGEPAFSLIDASGKPIGLRRAFKEIYLFCVVSDHYPALHFQARQFLEIDLAVTLQPPFVMDVFFLDVLSEMLPSPLRLLSFVKKRVEYTDRLHASHELSILGYHLKRSLWLEHDLDYAHLADDLCT